MSRLRVYHEKIVETEIDPITFRRPCLSTQFFKILKRKKSKLHTYIRGNGVVVIMRYNMRTIQAGTATGHVTAGVLFTCSDPTHE